MITRRARPFRGFIHGSRNDGYASFEFAASDATVFVCPIWSIDVLLELPALLGPGVYILVGLGDEADGSTLRAIVGEGGMLQERLAAHSGDAKLDFVWDVIAVAGPRVMSETIRLILQRRFLDEIVQYGGAKIVNRHDADRFTRSEHDLAVADRIMEDVRPFLCMAVPGLFASIPPVTHPIGTRCAGLPRGVDVEGITWSRHEMRFRGAHATASMQGRVTMLLPGSCILKSAGTKPRWLSEKRQELIESGALRSVGDGRLLLLTTMVCFETAREAAIFVSGGASISARLVWTPIDP
jgi:hypothetical protein